MKFVLAVAVLCILAANINAGKLDNPSQFIINGADVTGIMPAYGYLEIYELPGLQGGIFFGGSVLISVRAALTSAQNVKEFQSFRVGLGGIRIQDLEWSLVSSAHPHPLYDSATLANNIAVLQLVTPIIISERIIPISRLPDTSQFPLEGDAMAIFGFGFGATDNQPNILQEARLTVLSQAACGYAYPHLINSGQLNNYFCASNTTAASNICAGDQGSPVIALNLLVGIISFNRRAECGHPESQPAASIRVNQYNQFINSIIG